VPQAAARLIDACGVHVGTAYPRGRQYDGTPGSRGGCGTATQSDAVSKLLSCLQQRGFGTDSPRSRIVCPERSAMSEHVSERMFALACTIGTVARRNGCRQRNTMVQVHVGLSSSEFL